MAGLQETTARLAKLRRRTKAFEQAGGGGGGATRMVEIAGFGANPGGLRMLSHVPDGLPPGAPLVVVLHGCTQRAEAHAATGGWLELADRCGFAVIAPEQTTANNPNRCFNWYEPADARRGRGEAASIRAMVAHAVREHRLDPARVFVTGLSAGGAMTAVMLATYPEVFAGGGIVAGLPFGVADTLQAALSAMFDGRERSAAELGDHVRRGAPVGGRVPRLSIWHGDADGTVKPHNAGEIAKQWASAHGLPSEPSETQRLPGRTRAVWRAPDTGEVLIESHLLRGMGHGTPLSTGGAEGVGTAAPYMLEAGVSSTLEIARFWGIAEAAAFVETPANDPEPARKAGPAEPAVGGIGAGVMSAVGGRVPAEVEQVIARALRTAGLMR